MDNQLLGGLSPEQFLQKHWQISPLLVRNAFPDIQPLISPDELAGMALEPEVESRLVIKNPDTCRWSLKNGPFNEETFASLPPSHWTLLVQALDHWIPEAEAFLQTFSFLPRWRIDDLMVSYATKEGGVGPHFDYYDVFLIQVSGQRRWELGPGHGGPLLPDSSLMILADWQPEQSYLLNPGDMLYIPPGLGHNGVAESDDCVTYSVGFRAPSFAEIWRGFSDYVGEQLQEYQRYSDCQQHPQNSNPGEITLEATNRVRRTLQYYLNRPDLIEDWFGQQMTEAKYPDQQLLEQADASVQDELQSLLAENSCFCCTEGWRFAYRQTDGYSRHLDAQAAFVLYVNGQHFPLNEQDTAFVQGLCDRRQVQATEVVTAKSRQLLADLLASDAVFVAQ